MNRWYIISDYDYLYKRIYIHTHIYLLYTYIINYSNEKDMNSMRSCNTRVVQYTFNLNWHFSKFLFWNVFYQHFAANLLYQINGHFKCLWKLFLKSIWLFKHHLNYLTLNYIKSWHLHLKEKPPHMKINLIIKYLITKIV